MLLPALQKVGVRFTEYEGHRRAAVSGIAVERYRIAHNGQLPAKLDDLVPQFLTEVPSDPFDGQAIRFKTLPKGFVVYSIGSDRVDDSGAERTRTGMTKNYDETFTVER